MHPVDQHKSVEPSEKRNGTGVGKADDMLLERANLISSEATTPYRFYSPIAMRIMVLYIIIWALSCLFLSDTFLTWIGLSQEFLTQNNYFKRFIFLIFTAPILYLIVAKYNFFIQTRNRQLEEIKEKMLRLNIMHRMLSQINHTILRITSREQLLNEVCQIVHQKGKYAFVWIGLGETEVSLPKMIASAGQGDKYLKELFDALHLASADERGEPGLAALRKKNYIIINDLKTYSKKQLSWQRRALSSDYYSMGAFPLKTTSGQVGVIALYSSQAGYFNEEEVQLLRELAADVSYGLSDIEQKEQIYYAANFDVTTNLPNQQLFEDRLNQSIKRALHDKRYIGVALIEIKDLIHLTELHGHAAADKLLFETGKYLTSRVRDGDTVARIGKNGIGVMLTDVAEISDIAIVVHKLLRPFLVRLSNLSEIQVPLKAGVSIYPKDSHSGVTLIEQAQTALSQMDVSDKMECAFYSKELSHGVKYTKQIEEELENAVEKEEFHLYYQPIVSLETRTIVAVEALVRWQNQKLGEVSPVQFIPIAEQMDLMEKLGEWILKTACMQLVLWRNSGIDNVTLTVNLSSKQLMSENFLEKIKKTFNKIGFNPKEYSLGLEIPEDALVDESKNMITTFFALKELGLKLYIDDFGTGYASLNYLHKLPVDGLKIDSLFIRTLDKDHNTKDLIKGILAFSSGLGVNSIAEGVETEKQIKILQELGCVCVQGYFFSPPVTAKSIEKLFNKGLY